MSRKTVEIVCPRCGERGRFYIIKGRFFVYHPKNGRRHGIERIIRKMAKTVKPSKYRPELEPTIARLAKYVRERVNQKPPS